MWLHQNQGFCMKNAGSAVQMYGAAGKSFSEWVY